MTSTIDKYCLFGNPVEHSKSPRIHMRFAELTGQHLVYDKVCAPVDGFAQAVAAFRALGGRGCNITVPFKLQVAALATEVTQRAQLAGACNILKFDGDQVLADNSDGQGLVRDITLNAGFDLQGRDVLLIGGGGAAAGVLGPLTACKPRRILVAHRPLTKAAHIVQVHAGFSAQHQVDVSACDLHNITDSFDLVINSTSASLTGGGVPVPASVLRKGALAVDLMYGPASQGFMQWANDNGASAIDGLGMLVEQAAEAFYVWRGVMPPASVVMAELRQG